MATADAGSLASILSGLFTGGLGISQLMGGNATQSAAMASPFQSQYASYQPQVQGAIGNIQQQQAGSNNNLSNIIGSLESISGGNPTISGAIGAIGGLNTNAGSVPTSVSSAGGNLASSISNLSSNYLNDPVIQSELQTGMSTVNRGLAAEGLSGSGAQQVELQQYGEQFAQGQYQTQLQDLISGSQAAFGENVGATQLGAQLQGQTFSQGLQQQQGIGGLASTLSQLQTGQLTSAGSLATQAGSMFLNSDQGLLNSLEALSGATTGSPSTAGIINSEQFGQTQQGVANLGSGATGLLSGLSSLFGGSGGTGGLGSILSGLGTSDTNGLLGSLFGGGSVSNIFGNSTTDLGTLGGNVLGDAGATLGGVDAGTSVGSDLASSFL